jgi:TolB-like protein/Flp pilus assembly protein TadD
MPLANSRLRFTGFLEELKRRKVPQAAAGYAVVAWVLLQIGEVTFEPLGVPSWGMTVLVVLVVALFPFALLVSWFFDLTLNGFVKDRKFGGFSQSGQQVEHGATTRDPGTPSIAVRPFDDMSSGQDQAYLCDGIAEEILNRLSQIKNLRVASRTSSFRFKGLRASAIGIGEELGVATVLEGSVRKADNHLRVTTQLINIRDGFLLWSGAYDRNTEDIFEIQGEIAAEVAEALEVTLGTRDSRDCCTTADAKAYDYYLRGQHYFRRWGTRNMEFAIQMFQKAVDIDSGYARAWAALAESYSMTCMYWNTSREILAAADRASMKALELLPGLAECHVSRGLSYFIHREEAAAIAEFETAQHLDPGLFEAWYFYGRVRFQRGEMELAADLFEHAERIDPDDFQAPIFLRQIYRSLGRQKEAQDAALRGVNRAKRHLELNPDDTRALNLGLGGLADLGRADEVKQFARRSLAIDGENPDTLYNVACGYAKIGEPNRAMECLEHAAMHGMAIGAWAENDSDLDSLKDLPRFQQLIRRLKQEETAALGPKTSSAS